MQNEDKKGSLSETFESFGAAPKADAWDAIAASLDEPKRKRRAVIWWWSSGLAAVLIIGFTTLTFFQQTDEAAQTESKKVAQQTEHQERSSGRKTDVTVENQATQPTYVKNNSSQIHPNNTFSKPSAQKNTSDIRPEKKPFIPATTTQFDAITAPNEIAERNETNLPDNESDSNNTAVLTPARFDSSTKNTNSCEYIVNVSYTRWRFGLYGERDFALSNTDPVKESYSISDPGSSNFDTYTYPNYDSTPYMIKSTGVQLSIGRSFLPSRRLWIESGLQYTSFKSDKNVDLGPTQKGWLKHEAIGIPVTVNYQFIRSLKWSVGISAGLLNQWVYKSTQKVTASGGGVSIAAVEKPDKTTIYKDRFHLLSGVAGLDFSYSFNQQWQFSIQPQFRYYFGSGSDSQWPTTIRRGWMGGTVGLRYCL